MTSLTNHASTANRRLLIMYGSQTGVAESIAKSLHENKLTSEVIYPGLESHPQYELASRQQLNPNGQIF